MTGRKPGFKAMIWNKRKKETSNWNRMKKQEFKKMKRPEMFQYPNDGGLRRRRTTARN